MLYEILFNKSNQEYRMFLTIKKIKKSETLEIFPFSCSNRKGKLSRDSRERKHGKPEFYNAGKRYWEQNVWLENKCQSIDRGHEFALDRFSSYSRD